MTSLQFENMFVYQKERKNDFTYKENEALETK